MVHTKASDAQQNNVQHVRTPVVIWMYVPIFPDLYINTYACCAKEAKGSNDNLDDDAQERCAWQH